jgi:uncharacterized membrane protein
MPKAYPLWFRTLGDIQFNIVGLAVGVVKREEETKCRARERVLLKEVSYLGFVVLCMFWAFCMVRDRHKGEELALMIVQNLSTMFPQFSYFT